MTTPYLKVVKQPAWSGNHKVHSLGQLVCLVPPVSPTHDDAMGVVVMLQQLRGNAVGLEGEFSGGGDDYHPGTLEGRGDRQVHLSKSGTLRYRYFLPQLDASC